MIELLTSLTQAGLILTFEYRDEMFFVEGTIEADVVFSLCSPDMTSCEESIIDVMAVAAFNQWSQGLP